MASSAGSSSSEEFFDAKDQQVPVNDVAVSRNAPSRFIHPALPLTVPSPDDLRFEPTAGCSSPTAKVDATKLGVSVLPRHQRLGALRDRIVNESLVRNGDETASNQYLSPKSFDQTSVASWAKELLNEMGAQQQQTASTSSHAVPDFQTATCVVSAMDTMSTKGASVSPIGTVDSSTIPEMFHKRDQQQSRSKTLLQSWSNEERGHTSGSGSQSKSSSNSCSGASSKSSTIDRGPANNPQQLCKLGGSLDQITPTGIGRFSRATSIAGSSISRANKSNSLPRDAELTASDDYWAQQLERKNSAAAEIIESLVAGEILPMSPGPSHSPISGSLDTSPRLPGLPEERAVSPSNHDSIGGSGAPNRQGVDTPDGSANESRAHHSRQPSNADTIKAEDNLSSPDDRGSVHTPDIVASNTVRKPEVSISTSAPVAPPRRKKHYTRSLSGATNSTDQSPTNSQHATMKSMTPPTIALSRHFTESGGSQEILDSVMLKNLDTGEQYPLSKAEHPLSVHIMKLAEQEHLSGDADGDSTGSDRTSISSYGTTSSITGSTYSTRQFLKSAKIKTAKAKRQLQRQLNKTVRTTTTQLKNVKSHLVEGEKDESASDEEQDGYGNEERRVIRIRAAHHHNGPYEFDQVKMVQEIHSSEHKGPIWCVRFSLCGRLMATAGQDGEIRVWVLKDAHKHFQRLRSKYSGGGADYHRFSEMASDQSDEAPLTPDESVDTVTEEASWAPFMPTPFERFKGHSSDVLDIAWSKNYFLLSSSMDQTVRLWHLTRTECLCCFRHGDFVTAIAFLPKDDKYFLSGSLDGKLRLWHIPEKKVVLWNEVNGVKFITAMTFVRSGKQVAVGTFDGRCIFYMTDQLNYVKTLFVKSNGGKNKKPHKVTGLESYSDRILVTSNDSRIRLYDLRDFSLVCKYKGFLNSNSQIKATFSPDMTYIISGSENRSIYIWHVSSNQLTLSRKDRNKMWECIRAHNSAVTAAVFAPKPEMIFDQIDRSRCELKHRSSLTSACSSPAPQTPQSPNARFSRAASVNNHHNRNHKPEHSSVFHFHTPHLAPLASSATLATSQRGQSPEVLISADLSGTILIFLRKPMIITGSSSFSPRYD